MASPSIVIRSPKVTLGWTVARWSALVAVLALLIALLIAPASALKALWYVAVPILPATFFISTKLWRGICPLATLNEIGNHVGRPRPLAPTTAGWLAVAGLVLFHLMVPARRFMFNENGLVLALTVAGVGGLALVLGALFQVRSAFCNALCPVLPVELLYGQAPFARMERTRCASCSVCTPQGCLDLAETKAIPQLLGPTRRTARWLVTPYGAFFAGLPGFIVGYNQVPDGPLGTALVVYGTTLAWTLASFFVIGLVVLALRVESMRALPFIAATAGGLYYWYAGPTLATQFGAPEGLAFGIQAVGIGLVAWWLARAFDYGTRARASAPSPSIR
jgi:hypothetical protein